MTLLRPSFCANIALLARDVAFTGRDVVFRCSTSACLRTSRKWQCLNFKPSRRVASRTCYRWSAASSWLLNTSAHEPAMAPHSSGICETAFIFLRMLPSPKKFCFCSRSADVLTCPMPLRCVFAPSRMVVFIADVLPALHRLANLCFWRMQRTTSPLLCDQCSTFAS